MAWNGATMVQPNARIEEVPESVDSEERQDEMAEDAEYMMGNEDWDPSEWLTEESLPEIEHKRMTARELHKALHEGQIDLSPPYQRDVVWAPKKQQAFINSLLQGFDTPKLYFSLYDGLDPDGDPYPSDVWRVIDGKQRLTAITRFMDGGVHIHNITKKKWFYVTPASQSKLYRIPLKIKETFDNITFDCVRYKGLSEVTERDIFQRLQLGVALTEKLRAIHSPLVKFIDRIEEKYLNPVDGIPKFTKWNPQRAMKFRCIAHAAAAIEAYPTYVCPSHGALENWFRKATEPSEDFIKNVDNVFAAFLKLTSIPDSSAFDKRINKGLISPSDFVYIALLLHVSRRQSTDVQGSLVLRLRKHLNKNFRDKFLNGKLGKVAHDHIRTIEDELPSGKSSRAGKKRKRHDSGSESEDDYRP
ncbi:hypothetical protein SISNIDRAFT_448310 [Sistotremastrum niveocremeum HHB9708]|uniref:GmrSD restriction endonucleases N-terminal domain-containing protein n=1 Tax=Sistotremastrum niveocremeum HHB9708 TaxID=1314777 RepID=A0A164ZWA7_9AGAM|nr:hypothetical protein SISNIDRAFT_448310 [Sistotremastrum niveocremeum HHB9708]